MNRLWLESILATTMTFTGKQQNSRRPKTGVKGSDSVRDEGTDGEKSHEIYADDSCLREVNHFLIILVDNLVKSLAFPQVVKVGIFPDLVELLKARSKSSLKRV